MPARLSWAHSYGYDAANRLNAGTSPAGTFSYTYNAGVVGVTPADTGATL